jgi:hypothetical protein
MPRLPRPDELPEDIPRDGEGRVTLDEVVKIAIRG